jgi:hypothetical protein
MNEKQGFFNQLSSVHYIILVVALLIGIAVGSGKYFENQEPAVENITANTIQDELPDWSGVWAEDSNTVFDHASVSPVGSSASARGTREFPPFTDEWEEVYQQNLALVLEGKFPDPITPCGIPAGFPRIFNLPDVYEFVVRPEQTWILSENGPNVMRIYTDGRDHPPVEERWPLYTGDSVGHWEGDVLVFSTLSVNNEGTILDRTGLTLSNEMTAVTRIQKVDGVLEVNMTLEDPLALKSPWSVTSRFEKLAEGSRVYDYACGENNRNPVMEDGYTITLGPDGEPLEDIE